jgi:ABC-type antimicrobial peptide transport system ATPase subunit
MCEKAYGKAVHKVRCCFRSLCRNEEMSMPLWQAAQALVHDPDLLFLDEPTTGVDPVSRRDFWRILSRFLREGITVLVSTPYLDEAERFSRVALMHEGRIIACDTPQDLRSQIRGELIEVRAEPIAALYEKGKIIHTGFFTQLENELVGSTPTTRRRKAPTEWTPWCGLSARCLPAATKACYNTTKTACPPRAERVPSHCEFSCLTPPAENKSTFGPS